MLSNRQRNHPPFPRRKQPPLFASTFDPRPLKDFLLTSASFWRVFGFFEGEEDWLWIVHFVFFFFYSFGQEEKLQNDIVSPYLVATDAMLLLELLPVFQPPHGRRWVSHGRAAELDGVGGWHGVEPLLHFVRVCPVRSPCSKGTHPETSAPGNWAPSPAPSTSHMNPF